MPGISIHVVDVSRGVLAAGMHVALYALEPRRLVVEGRVSASGLLEDAALAAVFPRGGYEAVFDVAAYYREAAVALPEVPFLDVVTYRFGVGDPQQHYHLPMKLTPWGYSCFRGGA